MRSLAVLIVALWSVSVCADERPNILLITADTFRASRIGYDGHDADTSPNIDSLSAAGVYFRKAFTTSGWTAPGLVSIHTSLYAPAHGVDVRGRSIDPSVTTLAEALRAAGYRAPDIFFLTDIFNFKNLGLEPWPERARHVRDGDEILFRWLRQEASASDRPFFLYYHYRDLHQPYAAGEPYESMFVPRAFGHPWNPFTWMRRFLADEKIALVKREVMMPRGIIDFAPWDQGWIGALYDAEVRRMDERLFGRLRQLLRELDLERKTILVISADHGEELMEDGVVGHVSTYQEGRLKETVIRIPLIFHAPGRLPAGLVVDEEIVQAIDVMPTLLDLAGAPAPPGMQGRSLVPLFHGQDLPDRPAFFETSGGGYTASEELYAQRARAVRTTDWKLVWYTPSDRVELYDLDEDPDEDDNVAADHPAIADSLLGELRAWVARTPRRQSADAAKPSPSGQITSTEIDGRVEVLFPPTGETFDYVGAEQTIQLQWTGPPDAAYTVEYEIGQGAYHLEGTLEMPSSTPTYGPFHEDFWNSLVLYNPWSFRVYPVGRPEAASDWVTFELAPGGDGSLSFHGHLLLAAGAVRRTAGELIDLGRGLLQGLVDLGLWLARLSAADVTAWALLAAIVGALLWPRLEPLGEERLRAWGFLLVYVAAVYATVPVFPAVWGRLREHTGPEAIAHLGTIAVLAACAGTSIFVWRRSREGAGRVRLALFVVVLCAYVWFLHIFGRFPAERLHLLEYGLMAVFLLRALRLNARPLPAYAGALVLTGVIGFGDETIQWILPQRFFELKDAALNVAAGTLGLSLAALAGMHERHDE